MVDEGENGPGERKPLGAVVIPPGEVTEEERRALAEKLYDRMMGNLPEK